MGKIEWGVCVASLRCRGETPCAAFVVSWRKPWRGRSASLRGGSREITPLLPDWTAAGKRRKEYDEKQIFQEKSHCPGTADVVYAPGAAAGGSVSC